LEPHQTNPSITCKQLNLSPEDRLPEDVIAFILEADTIFIGSTYAAREEEKENFPSHVGMNQRGGRAGFVRVKPSDGRTVVLPDYSGLSVVRPLLPLSLTDGVPQVIVS